ncbi:MAG: hypothetical protein JJ863_06135 [Deltaproteobacteria bacterium]|nr:hypothetical protein [Deltaproteobacteria bacterium]
MSSTLRVALALVVLTACEPEPLTQVLIAVDTDLNVPDEMDRVLLEVRGPDGVLRVAEGTLADESDLPATLGLLPGSDPEAEVSVTAIGLMGDEEVLRRVATFSFVSDEVRVLWLRLHRACVGVSCGASETCAAGRCRPAEVQADELTPYEPPIARDPTEPDGGMSDAFVAMTDGGTDAGLDGGRVDGGPEDGGPLDGGGDVCTDLPASCGVGPARCTCDGCRCDVSCTASCGVECRSSESCNAEARSTGGDFSGVCQGSTCAFDARMGGTVDVVARAGATLELDCRGATSCAVTCRGMSECLVRCAGGGPCGITCNPGSEQVCPGGVRVCNRACP